MKPKTLPDEIVALLLPRLKDELTAYYFYRAASNYCQNVGYSKAALFFSEESNSELEHAKKIEDFLIDWNVIPALPAIVAPKLIFNGYVQLIQEAYNIEYKLYEEYEDTSIKIFKAGDICAFDFLQQFRKIQSDSVKEYSDMLNVLDGVKEDKFSLLMLEKKLFK